MKKLIFCLTILASLAAFAGSAEPDGTDFVVTADAGETYTVGTAIGNYARLVKRGAGEVVLTAATTAFAGDVMIETGTLAITDLKALGTGTPVTVESGATFYLKTPHGTGQNQARFTGHVITISGDGVDNKGAIRFHPPDGAGTDDNMFSTLNLAADATIECDYRWGINGVSSGTLNLNGHTLRRIWNDSARSGDQWMLNACTVNGGGGTVEANKGRITFQTAVNCSADTTFVSTNSSNYLLWQATKSIPSTFKLFNGRTLSAYSGEGPNHNHISGPVHLLDHANHPGGTVTFEITKNNVLHLDGPLTGESGANSTAGVTYYRTGTGRLYLNGDVSIWRNTYHQNGGLTAMTSTASRVFSNGFVINEASEVLIGGGHTLLNWIRVGNGTQRGIIRQTGGVLGVRGDTFVGESAKGVSHWVMSGGEACVSNAVYIGAATNSFGSFRQTGGLYQGRSGNFVMHAGRAGFAVYHQSGGTNDSLAARIGQSSRFRVGYFGGPSDVTISGTGTVMKTEYLLFGSAGQISTNVFNVNDGAVVGATRLGKLDTVADGFMAVMNFDGGTLMPLFGHGWCGLDASEPRFLKRAPTHSVIWGKGLVIDTSESSGSSNSQPSGFAASHMQLHFESPTGKGVESVALPTASGFVSSNYHGIARVVFEDATGWGASAYAEYDYDAKKVTHIVVTSRGCDYSDDTKAYLESPDRLSRYECGLTLTSNEGKCGELVKRGAQTLYLYATNTLTGGIAVESGKFVAATTGVVPSNTPVRVESGATMQFTVNRPTVLSTFTGAGSVTGCDITVTNAVRATCAELFTNKHATFGNALTFADGSVFEITDPENLETYKCHGSVRAFTAQTVNGTPTLRIPDAYTGSTKWALFKSGAGSYNFGPIIGTMILLK